MHTHQKVCLIDMVLCLSGASDLISPLVANHQKRVAWISAGLAQTLGLDASCRRDLVIAAALHDVGAFSLRERLEDMMFDSVEGVVGHSVAAHLLLKNFAPLARPAELILYHHIPWRKASLIPLDSKSVLLANILFMADRIDNRIRHGEEILSQTGAILAEIKAQTGQKFAPDVVDAFLQLGDRECFWFDLVSPDLSDFLKNLLPSERLCLASEDLVSLTDIFSQIIDFRSRFTALHSSGVAACAEAVSERLGMKPPLVSSMGLAGRLHDIGKLSIAGEILDKPGDLSTKEYGMIKRHPYYAHHLLRPIPELSTINQWISYHHESPCGRGYPFKIEEASLPLGSRVLAVADVFTAASEDRPYRKAMSPALVRQTLERLTLRNGLDSEVVGVLLEDLEDLLEINRVVQNLTLTHYQGFDQAVRAGLPHLDL